MKKFIKGCFVVSLVMILLGTVLGGIGYALGGNEQVNQMVMASGYYPTLWPIRGIIEKTLSDEWGNQYRYEVSEKFDDFTDEIEHDLGEIEDDLGEIEFANGVSTIGGEHQNKELAKKDAIQNLEIELGGGKFNIYESKNDYFQIISHTTSSKYQYYIEGNKLVIKGFDHIRHLSSIEDEVITLYIPKDKEFNEVDINVGGIMMEIESLKAREVDIEIGVGEVKANKLETDELDIKVAAGRAVVKESQIQYGNFETGVGELEYQGGITGNLDVECAMGNVSIILNDRFEDHNYELEGTIGNVKIEDQFQTGMIGERWINNEANSTFSLECGLGNLEIEFDK